MADNRKLPIPGYPDYTVTPDGRVFRNGKPIRTYPAACGHTRVVTLWRDGKRKIHMLHKVVAETYHVPEADVKKALYEGFRLDPEAVKRIRARLLAWQAECEKDPFFYHDDLLYLKKFLKDLESET